MFIVVSIIANKLPKYFSVYLYILDNKYTALTVSDLNGARSNYPETRNEYVKIVDCRGSTLARNMSEHENIAKLRKMIWINRI